MTIKAPFDSTLIFQTRFLIDCAATFSALCTAKSEGVCICVCAVYVCKYVSKGVCECL